MKYHKLIRREELLKLDIEGLEILIKQRAQVTGPSEQGYRKNSALHQMERLRRKQLSTVQDLIWGYPTPRPSHFPVDSD